MTIIMTFSCPKPPRFVQWRHLQSGFYILEVGVYYSLEYFIIFWHKLFQVHLILNHETSHFSQ